MRRRPCALAVLGILVSASYARSDDAVTPQEKQARERYERTLATSPTRGTAFERLYQSYVDHEGTTALVKHFEQLSRENSGKAAYPLVIAFIQERQGDEQAALTAYAEAAKREPGNYRPAAAAGRLLWHMRRYEDAKKQLRQAIDLKPPREELQQLYETLGKVHAAQGDNQAAKKVWLELAALFPRDVGVAEELADLLVEENQFDEAIAQYQRLRTVSEDPYIKMRAAHRIAEIRLREDKFDDAKAIYRELLDQLAPGSWLRAETRRRLEEAFRGRGDTEGLARFYAEFLNDHADDVEIQLAVAGFYRQMGQAEAATERYKKIVERVPSRADARTALGELFEEQGRFADAAEQYRAVAEAAPHEAEGWERLGAAHFENLDLPEAERKAKAIEAWRNIFAQRPKDAGRALRTAEVFRARKLEPEALEHYGKAVELDPKNVPYREYLGEYLHQLGRQEEAVQTWRGIARDERATPENWLRLAQIFGNFNFVDEALRAIDEGLKTAGGPEGYSLAALRCDVLLEHEKYSETAVALEDLGRRADTPARKREIMERRVDLHRRAGQLAQEAAKLKTALASQPKNADGYELLARLEQANSHGPEATAAIEAALEIEPNAPERLTLAADLYRQAGNATKAIELLRRLIVADPRQETAHLEQIIDLAQRRAEPDAAIAAAQRLIEINPENERGYALASDLFWAAGKTDEAVAVLRRGTRQLPNEVSLHLQLARRLLDLNQLRPALDQFWRAFQAAEDDTKKLSVITELAQAYISTGQFDRLIDRLNEWRRDPEMEIVAAQALASAYLQSEQRERAEPELLRALEKQPNNMQIIEQLVRLAEESGRTEQAIQYAEKLISLRPNDPQALQRVGGLLYQAGRVSEAILRWRASLQASGKDPAAAALELADTLFRSDLRREGLQTLFDAAARFPDDWRIAYRLAVQLKHDRQHERAARLLEELIAGHTFNVKLQETPPASGGPVYAAPPAQVQEPDTAMTPWIQLATVQPSAAVDFSPAESGYGGYGYSYYYRSRGYYGRSGGAVQYAPPNWDSARIAALTQRLHLAELQGKLPDYLAELGQAAGCPWPAERFAKAARDRMPAPTEEKLFQQQRDPAARRVLLQALLIVNLSDLAFQAARELYEAAPGDHEAAALLCALATAPANGERGYDYRTRRNYRTYSYGPYYSYNSYSQPYYSGNSPAYGWVRPKCVERGEFRIDPVLETFFAAEPKPALLVALTHAERLVREDRKDEAVRWINQALTQRLDAEPQLRCATTLLLCGRVSDVVSRLADLRAVVKKEAQLGAAVGRPAGPGAATGGAPQQRQWERQTLGQRLLGLAQELFNHEQKEVCIELLSDALDLTRPQNTSGTAANPGYNYNYGSRSGSVTFSADPSETIEFPSPNMFFESERLGWLREWYERFQRAGLLEKMIAQLEERLARAGPDDRPDAVMALALLDGFEKRLDSAKKRLAEAGAALDDDRLRLVAAQVLAQQELSAQAIEQLEQVRVRVGPLFRDAQVGLLKLAAQTENKPVGQRAAQHLLGLRLPDETKYQLVPYLKKLGLEQEAAQMQMRSAAGGGSFQPYGSYNRFGGRSAASNKRLEQLMRLAMQPDKKDAVLSLVRRIIVEKTRAAQINAQDAEVTAALNALRQLNALEDETKRLETDLQANPNSTDALLQLYIYRTAQNEPDQARAALEKAFDLLPDNLRLRHQHAVMLAAQGQPREAVAQFEKILRDAPWLIEAGEAVASAYTDAGRTRELVDFILTLEPARQLSVERNTFSLRWLEGVAGALIDTQPEAALKIYRHRRKLESESAGRFQVTQILLRQLIKQEKPDELLEECKQLLPAELLRDATGTAARRDLLKQAAISLLRPTLDEDRAYRFDRQPEVSSQAGDIARLLARKQKLADLETLLRSGNETSEWRDFLGRGWLALAALAKEPPASAPAEEFLNFLQTWPDAANKENRPWRQAVQQTLTEALAQREALLPLAKRFADDLLPRLEEQNTNFRDRLALLSVQAQAELAAGNPEAARKRLSELAGARDPRYARSRGMGGNAGRIGWEEFMAKRPFLEPMLEKGFLDIALNALTDTMASTGENDRWMLQQAEELLGRWLRNGQAKGLLAAHIEKLEKELAQKPKDAALTNRLMHYYRAAGEKEKADALLKQASAAATVTGEQALTLARELHRAGRKEEARKLVLDQIRDGYFEFLQNDYRFRTWFNTPAAAEELVETIEKLPREPRFMKHGDWWLTMAAQMIQSEGDRTTQAELRMRELAQRLYRTADDFSRVSAPQYRASLPRNGLEAVVKSLMQMQRYDEAWEYVFQAVFNAKAGQLPEPTLGTLFSENRGDEEEEPDCLATRLIWLARKTNRLDALRQAILTRKQNDPLWEDTALRLLALLEFETSAPERAGAWLAEILKRPPPPSQQGGDSSLGFLAKRVARMPELKPKARDLLTKLVDQAQLSQQQNNALLPYALELLRWHIEAGDLEKAEALLTRMANFLPSYYREYLPAGNITTVLAAPLADWWMENGHFDRAIAGYRDALRRPAMTNLWIPGLSQRYNAGSEFGRAAELRKALERLKEENKLDSLMEKLREEWAKTRDQPPGKRDCEPLVVLAACHIVQGDLQKAAEMLGPLEIRDYPMNLALALECLLATPLEADGLQLMDTLLARWPYLCAPHSRKLGQLYASRAHSFPLNGPFQDYLNTLPPPKETDNNDDPSWSPYRYGGRPNADPNLPPPPETQRNQTARALAGFAESYFNAKPATQRKADAHFCAIVELLARRLGERSQLARWLDATIEADPAKAWDMVRTYVDLAPAPDSGSEKIIRLTTEELFDLTVIQADPENLEADNGEAQPTREKEDYAYRPLTALIIEASQKAGKLDELILLCEQAIRRGEAKGAAPKEVKRKEIAARLHLIALAAGRPAEAEKLLPLFLEGRERFARGGAEERLGNTVDPATRAVAEACWDNAALRPRAIEILKTALDTQKKSKESNEEERGYDGPNQQDATFQERLANMQLVAGDKAGAVATLREWIKDGLEQDYDLNMTFRSLGYIDARSLMRLAREHHAEAEMLALLQELRGLTADKPRANFLLAQRENELRSSLGQDIPLGIVLAAQAGMDDRLQFIWQLNHETPPTPPEQLVDEKWAILDPPVRWAQNVVFVEAAQAVSMDGFRVRIEQSADGRTFEPLAEPAIDEKLAAGCGAYMYEQSIKPGRLQWYRARLLKGDQIVATSSSVAAIAGANLFAGGCFGEKTAADAPPGWKRGPLSDRVEFLKRARPGSADFQGVRCASGQMPQLYTPTATKIDANHWYVISGWAVTVLPDSRAAQTASHGPSSWANRSAAWTTLLLEFENSQHGVTGAAHLQAENSGAAVFIQCVLRGGYGEPDGLDRHWLAGFDNTYNQGTLPPKTAGVKFNLNVGSTTAAGHFVLTGTTDNKPQAAAKEP